VHRLDPVPKPTRIRCARCGAEIYRTSEASVDAAMAWALSALTLFIVANAYPLVALKVSGSTRLTTLIGASFGLYQAGYTSIAGLVLFTTVVVPLAQVGVFLWLLAEIKLGRLRARPVGAFRLLAPLRPWGMVEVFLLGALVALTKLAAMATIVPGIALAAYFLFMLTLSSLASATPSEQLWQWIARTRS
jgi:paraquat-inducible protein A